MRVKILGRYWRFRWCNDDEMIAEGCSNEDGFCSDPTEDTPTIGVRRGLSSERTLDVIIHECLHAAAWHYRSEDEIAAEATDIARVLMQVGTWEPGDA